MPRLGSPLVFHRFYVLAASAVKYVVVRQLLEVRDVANELHRVLAMKAGRSGGLACVTHDETP
jgi:hypothetical protein